MALALQDQQAPPFTPTSNTNIKGCYSVLPYRRRSPSSWTKGCQHREELLAHFQGSPVGFLGLPPSSPMAIAQWNSLGIRPREGCCWACPLVWGHCWLSCVPPLHSPEEVWWGQVRRQESNESWLVLWIWALGCGVERDVFPGGRRTALGETNDPVCNPTI